VLRTAGISVVVACLWSSVARAQTDSAGSPPAPCPYCEPVEDVHPVQEGIAMFLLPKIWQDVVLLKEYIVSDEFQEIRRICGDRSSVDVLFRRGLRMSWNNPIATLVVVTFAVMDHRRFGVRVPLLGPLLWFPLTSEFPEEFSARRTALPLRLYPDSPPYGDRDKLQHFFGSALVAVLIGSRATAERVGSFIEWGEDRFIVEGSLDARDMEANSRGGRFGEVFLEDRAVLPSVYMTTPLSVPIIDTVQVHKEE
jgi:hypothetical protein